MRRFHKTAAFLMLLFVASAVFGDKKARVVTESGKKWDVIFIKMSNDTIYLKAHKPNGSLFSISGHKSKFKKVEFSNGSLLDFSLSDFPPVETPNKPRDIGDWSSGSGSFASAEGSSSAYSPTESKSDTFALPGKTLDSLVPQMLQDYDQTQDTVDADKEDKTPVKKLKTEKTGGQAKKKSHGFAISLCFLSVAALAGSGASYYFALDDQKKSENAKTSLGNAYVLGKTASGLIETNQRQNDSAKKKAKIAQILLGAGAVLLGAGIIFYF